MFLIASLTGAVVVALGWLLVTSYVDYLLARRRRLLERGYQLGRSRPFDGLALGALDPSRWLMSGVAVWILVSWLCVWYILLGVAGVVLGGLLVLVAVAAIAVAVAVTRSGLRRPMDRAPEPAASLNGVAGERIGVRVRLQGDELGIGRGPGNDMRLSDPAISRWHARIRRTGDQFLLEDLGSQTGTYLNGRRIKHAVLRDGDKIAIRDQVFTFRR